MTDQLPPQAMTGKTNPTVLYIPLSAEDVTMLSLGQTVRIETDNQAQGFDGPTVILIHPPSERPQSNALPEDPFE